MKRAFALTTTLCVTLCAGSAAQAACFADYKAKQDDPLQLHYGVVQLGSASACPSPQQASDQIAQRIGRDGWQLLRVLSLTTSPPSQKQRDDAGQYYLRY